MTSFFGKRFPVTASGFHAPAKLFIAANCWRLPHKVAYNFLTAARDSSQEDATQIASARTADSSQPDRCLCERTQLFAERVQLLLHEEILWMHIIARNQTIIFLERGLQVSIAPINYFIEASRQAGSFTRRFSSDSRQQPADKISEPRQETAARKTQPR